MIQSINRAIDYVENCLQNRLPMDRVSEQTFYSTFHFQRMFSMVCGLPFGEYIRKRKMSSAAEMITQTKMRTDDIAAVFGNDSVETFTKAFTRFHGITPKAAREPGVKLKSFCRICIIVTREGGCAMDYRIVKASFASLYGFCEPFRGDVVGRFTQEEEQWERSRDKQNELLEQTKDANWYEINMNFDKDGFEHYIAVESKAPILGYTRVDIPEGQYAVFETDRMNFPTTQLPDLRRKIASEWLPSSGYSLSDRPEITVTHWYQAPMKDNRYIEIWIPVSEESIHK